MQNCNALTLDREYPSLDPALLPYPSKLFVETTSRCNLSCVMCMKQHDPGSDDGDMDISTFAALEPALANLEALLLNGVGEPLLNPRLEHFISRGKELMPSHGWVGFQTNGLLLTDMRATSLLEAGLDRICLSMDGVDSSTFSNIRTGSQLHDLAWAFKALDAARAICGRPDLKIGVEYVVMRDNIKELPAALAWAADRGATFAIVSHLHPFHEPHLDQRAYDTCTDESIQLFQTWKSKAEVVRVDIHRYFQLLWKYRKSPEEERVINFVEAMKADAQDRGMTLDLKRLFAMDFGQIATTMTVFDEATHLARKLGMDLRLPEVVRREKRRCSFIEQGSAFISWNGAMHPCYHLWHPCRSFANGWHHPVRPRTFGNINQRGILDIWNRCEFRTFRCNVLHNDYPSCAGCNCSPCDLVQQEEFQQDCYVNTEPCGSCLWSSGVFRCLD